MSYTREELAYLAGFIDGEGCFYLGYFKTKSRIGNFNYNYHTILKVCNNNYEVLEWINNRFGGRIEKINKKTKNKKFEFTTYSVYFTGNTLTDLTKELQPFLIVKKKHALVMTKMRATFRRIRGGHPIHSEKTKKFRYECLIAMRKLNTRFHNHPLKAL